MPQDIAVGEETTYYGYSIVREGEIDYRVGIYADDLRSAKDMIKRCLEAGIINWPIQAAGRNKRED